MTDTTSPVMPVCTGYSPAMFDSAIRSTTSPVPFDYLIALDFEATCDNDADGKPKNPDPQEIIEIPLIIINTKTLQVEGVFHEYVRPTFHPVLSEFCKNLTGIEQKTVDASRTFQEVFYGDVCPFVEKHVGGGTFAFVTFGDWDLKTALPAQAEAVKLASHVPSCFKQWINLRIAYGEFFGKKKAASIPSMLEELSLSFEGHLHNGFDDTNGIKTAVVELLKRGWVPKITGSRDHEEKKNGEPPATWTTQEQESYK